MRAIVREILPAVGDVIAVQYNQDRSMKAHELAAIIGEASAELGPVTWPALRDRPSVTEPRVIATSGAMTRALYDATKTRHPGQILIAGSLFIVGEARTLLVGAPTDPILATDPSVRK